MAEFVFKHMVESKGLKEKFHIESCATSYEEIGNDIHRGTKRILDKCKIPYSKREAKRFKSEWYQSYDYIIIMDKNNYRNLLNIVGDDRDNKIHLLLEYANESNDISDPWYTGNFDKTYEDILRGLNGFLNKIVDKI